MTRLRRLLHALGWHWWTPWRSNLESADVTNVYIITFQHRHCRLCPAEQRRVVEV